MFSLSTHRLLPATLVALAPLLVVACGGGGGSDPAEPQTTVSGAVVDGYVRGATVTLYGTQGFGGPTPLATAVTDAHGDFVLRLPQDEMPAYFVLMSKGGVVIDTGMPAPTLTMVAMRERARYYVTPVTDRVLRQGLRATSYIGGFAAAEQALAAELGLTEAGLYDDPLAADAPAGLQAGLDRALAAGDLAVDLPDGAYRLRLAHLQKDHIGTTDFADVDALLGAALLEGTLTLSGGEVTGTIDGDTVSGRIQGANLVLGLEYPDGDGVVRLAGTVGPLGSLSGSYVDFDATGPSLSSGVFVASLLPENGVDAAGLRAAAADLYGGERNLLLRDLYGDGDLGWGAMGAVSLDTPAENDVTAPDFTITLNAAGGDSDTLSFQGGRLITLADGTPSGLMVLHYTDGGGDHAYLVQALGNRRGVYLAATGAGQAYAIGESYLARRDALGVDLLTANAGKEMAVAWSEVSVHWLGQDRDPDNLVSMGTLTLPDLTDAAGASGDAAADGVTAVSGSLLGLKSSAGGSDPDALDHEADHLALVELHPTGALQGDAAVGGTIPLGGVDAADWPVPQVGFLAPVDADTALLELGEAQLQFLARPLYTLDLEAGGPITLEDYRLAVITGTITSLGRGTATLSYRDAAGETGTLALTVENLGGIYHLHGPMGDEYFDLLWGAGGTRAVFLASTQADGHGKIYEIGEAFLSY